MASEMVVLGVLSLCVVPCIMGHVTGVGHDVHNCVYTFNVPHHGENCPHGSEEEVRNIQEVKQIMQRGQEQLTQQLANMAAMLAELKTLVSNNCSEEVQEPMRAGTHYTRWGASTCPQDTDVIYTGYAAKSHYTHKGGGHNYQCLTNEPEFLATATADYQSKSYIYGVEYEHQSSPVIPASVHDQNVPCAVCHVNLRGETLMIPAKRTCPSGWVTEYEGILMSEYHTHSSSEYICVDKDMEVLPGGFENQNGGLLYVVEAVCGSLACPPYIDGYEISCVVCTL